MPFFSIIIPSYNREPLLCRAVDSVLNQSFKDFELIVVDDGSTDATPSAMKKYGSGLIYMRQENSGVSAARNAGIIKSSAPHVLFLDSDDYWNPDKLIRHFRFIENNPGIRIHQTGEVWIRNGTRVNPGRKHVKPSGRIFRESLELCLISPSAVCVERTLFDEYGMFDPLLPACEDYDLWLSITSGENIGLITDRELVRYAGHSDQLSAKFWGMDRFRIYSIIKVLSSSGGRLSAEETAAAAETAFKKAEVLKKGYAKRKEETQIKALGEAEEIIRLLSCGSGRETDYPSLAEKLNFPRYFP